MAEIESETRFMWKLLLHIILTPWTILMVLLGKKDAGEIFRPFYDIIGFLFQPKAAIAMIIINIAVFFCSIFLLTTQQLELLVNYPVDVLHITRYFSFITSGFLHADLTHLLGNMAAIFIFGRVVEQKLGTLKTFIVYFSALIISGVINSGVNLILGNNIGSIGASGAVMGLVSAAIILDPFYITYELIIPLPVMIIGWLTLYLDIAGILSPISDNIAHFAHLGGFISVAFSMYVLGVDDRSNLKKGLIINTISLIGIALLYFFFLR